MKKTPDAGLYNQALVHLSKTEIDKALPLLQQLYFSRGALAERSLLHILNALTKAGRGIEAIHLLEDACSAYPDNDSWPGYLATLWMAQGDHAKALVYADRALELNPDNETMFINRACWLAGRCEDPVQARGYLESWGQRFMDPLTVSSSPSPARDLTLNRKLRVGYVSGDLKNHSVRYFIEPFLRGHDRSKFEVHAFMTKDEDDVTEFLKPLLEHWHNVQQLDIPDLLTFIRRLQIDILVDLSGHTDGERLAVFALRAAPVQVTWFGFMQTLGMKAMDWRLTDWGTSPKGTDAHYTEKLYRLSCMAAYSPPLNCEALYPSPYHRNDFVTMVSLNHTRKLGDQALALWRDILIDNPCSGLIVIGNNRDPDLAKFALTPRLEELGLPMDRVSITPRLTMLEFMALASVADFALDSFPISGGTTTLHSLWMGLPVLALKDPNFGGMSSSSALTLMGLQLHDCVANSIDHYQEMAGQWINQPAMIDRLRERCRPALQNSPLMDHQARVQDVERAFRFMWEQYVDDQGSTKLLEEQR
jgi:protein O-GlcNAc transferase